MPLAKTTPNTLTDQPMTTRDLTQEHMEICRQYAADPTKSMRDLTERLGYSPSSRKELRMRIKRAGIEWVMKSPNSTKTHRKFTNSELAIVRHYAADPEKTKNDLRKALKTSTPIIDRLIQQTGVQWVNRQDARMKIDAQTLDTLRRLAADNRISRDAAAKNLGITVTHMRQLCDHHKVRWITAQVRDRKTTRPEHYASRANNPQVAAAQAEKRPPQQPATERKTVLQLTPHTHNGRPGYRWHSPQINGGGWIAAKTKAVAEREAKRIINLNLERRKAA
jgi:DNA-binding MarR family transcriptional regulator